MLLTPQPLVSILMLTYNREQFLSTAIASVIAQSYTNWELVIIDDGSTDSTSQLVTSFGESRIRYLHHLENVGLHTRRKESLQYVKGDYVAILDSDDAWIDTGKIAAQVNFLEEQQECVLVGTFTQLIDNAGATIGESRFYTGDVSIREHILLRNQFTHSAVMMRTDALKKTAGYQPTLAEDLELFLQLGTHGTLANLPIVATAHRVHENSQNDHGIKMCSAVHHIIKKHSDYPMYKKALAKSYLRVTYCTLRDMLRKKP